MSRMTDVQTRDIGARVSIVTWRYLIPVKYCFSNGFVYTCEMTLLLDNTDIHSNDVICNFFVILEMTDFLSNCTYVQKRV